MLTWARFDRDEFLVEITADGRRPMIAAHQHDRIPRLDRTARVDIRKRSVALGIFEIGAGCDEVVGGVENLGQGAPRPSGGPVVGLIALFRIDIEPMSARGRRLGAACRDRQCLRHRRHHK